MKRNDCLNLFPFITYTKVGNKDDSPDKKVVETTDAQNFADQIKVTLFETSAKDNKNVEEVLQAFCFFLSLVFSFYCLLK